VSLVTQRTRPTNDGRCRRMGKGSRLATGTLTLGFEIDNPSKKAARHRPVIVLPSVNEDLVHAGTAKGGGYAAAIEPIPKPLPSAFAPSGAICGRSSVANPRRRLRLRLRLAPSGPPESNPT
jgi:hypothetical protein